MGLGLMYAGQPAEALESIAVAMRLDPHYPSIVLHFLAQAEFSLANASCRTRMHVIFSASPTASRRPDCRSAHGDRRAQLSTAGDCCAGRISNPAYVADGVIPAIPACPVRPKSGHFDARLLI
jgi:hypothetical protein